MYEDSKIYIIDIGSSNGTFVNNIRLSKAGKESDPTELFTGDIIKFGTEEAEKNKKVAQKPVVGKIALFMDDGVEHRERFKSYVFWNVEALDHFSGQQILYYSDQQKVKKMLPL